MRSFLSALAGGIVAALLVHAIEWLAWEPPGADDQYRPRIVVVSR